MSQLVDQRKIAVLIAAALSLAISGCGSVFSAFPTATSSAATEPSFPPLTASEKAQGLQQAYVDPNADRVLLSQGTDLLTNPHWKSAVNSKQAQAACLFFATSKFAGAKVHGVVLAQAFTPNSHAQPGPRMWFVDVTPPGGVTVVDAGPAALMRKPNKAPLLDCLVNPNTGQVAGMGTL